MAKENENNEAFLNIEKQLIKTDLKLSEIVKDTDEIKDSILEISSNVSQIQRTLAVQSNQLGEHMRRTNALEKIVQQNQDHIRNSSTAIATRVTVLETEKTTIEKTKTRDLVILGIFVALVDLIIKYAVKF